MGVKLAESDWRFLQRPPRTRRRRVSGRARHIRFATWTVLAVVLVCVLATIAHPARTAPSKGQRPAVVPVAIVVGGAIRTGRR